MKRDERRTRPAASRGRAAALGMTVALGFGQPLFLNNGYFDLVSAKLAWVLLLAVLGAGVLLVLAVSRGGRSAFLPPGRPARWMAAFTAAYTLSAACSRYADVWLGYAYRYNGAVLYLCLALLYLLLRGWGGGSLQRVGGCCIQGAGAVAGILTALNYCSIDPLGAFAQVDVRLSRIMTSTLGNVNFAAVLYLVGGVLALWGFLQQTGPDRVLHGVTWLCCSTALVCCASDGSAIGLAVVLVGLLWLPGTNWRRLQAFAGAAALTLGGCLAVGLLKWARRSTFFQPAPYGWLLNPRLAAPLCAAAAAAWLLLRRQARRSPQADLTVWNRRLCLFVGAALAAALLAAQLLAETLPESWQQRLVFGPQWGSNRGYVWGLTPKLFADLSLWEKLFGAGPDAVAHLLNPAYTLEMTAINGSPFDSMHNEYLQYLLCGGVVGLFCWLGVLLSHGRAALCGPDEQGRGVGWALTAYAVQAVFNIATPATTPVLFVLLACCGAPARADEAPPRCRRVLLWAAVFVLLAWPGAAWLSE